MSEIKPDANKKVNQLREMDARDRWRVIGNWLLDHAMIIIILLMVIYIQIQRPAFLATASIVNIIQLTATRLPIALGIAGAIILTGTDLSAGRVVGLGAFVSAILLQKAVEIQPGDTPEILQKRVMVEAEWQLLPKAVAMICSGEVE